MPQRLDIRGRVRNPAVRMSKRLASVTSIVQGLLSYLHTPSPELEAACGKYLASLYASRGGKATAERTAPEIRRARAKAAIGARWSKRPAGELPVDQAAILAQLRGMETATLKATSPRRRNAIAALVAAGKLWVVSQTATEATLSTVPPKPAK